MRASPLLQRDDDELASWRPYPERVEHEPQWHDHLADWTVTTLVLPIRRRLYDPVRQLAAIGPRANANAAELKDASEDALREVAAGLRSNLRRKGFTLELVARSFALVREVSHRRMGLRPFDVQLMGAWGLLLGRLVEMETGEGKTLTAAIAAATAALAGVPTHVITVNDYLAQRDAASMRPIYEALGLRVGVVVQAMAPDERRTGYACDITYCTNKDVAFDYLRDQVALVGAGSPAHLALANLRRNSRQPSPLVLRGLHFGIVDEADSVFIDEARTPLILSASKGSDETAQTCRQALMLARALTEGTHYTVDRRDRIVDLKDAARPELASLCEPLEGTWSSPRVRDELVRQALSAIHLFHIDQQYVVIDGKVQIVDEFTGRIMPDRSWERGLHQMIEAKEGVELTANRETLARITYPRLFRRYLRLSGMTGTGAEVARELWSTYRLEVVKIPLNRPSRRAWLPDKLLRQEQAKWEAVAESADRQARAARRPVLIGTRSVEASERLSATLTSRGLVHTLLNAKQDAAEAEIVAAAGQPGAITVATNMAGRGTDIRLDEKAAEHGGLHVILTECHESARIDRQLFGRCARQGDPGTCEAIVSLDDEVFRTYAPWLTRIAAGLGAGGQVPGWVLRILRFTAQAAAERRNKRVRRATLNQDRQLQRTLAFSGRRK